MKHAFFPFALLLSACTVAPPSPPIENPPLPPASDISETSPATRILDRDAAYRLRNNSGITLQWISWDWRGDVEVGIDDDGVWRLSGEQVARDGPGRVAVDGVVTEIGADYFLLDGRVTITDTPDAGRQCSEDKLWRFGVTQGREYWRLREFAWCDGLTDYVDIYF